MVDEPQRWRRPSRWWRRSGKASRIPYLPGRNINIEGIELLLLYSEMKKPLLHIS